MRDFMEVSRRYLFGPLCFAAMSLAHGAEPATAPSATSGGTGTTVASGSTATGSAGTTTTARSGSSAEGETRFVSRIASGFGTFAGSEANAESLALGLREGKSVTLSSGASGGQASAVTFTPPTRPMGHGNVVHALSLAQAQLAAQGIAQPTPEQLKVALMGGTIATGGGETARTTTYQGILQLRAQGVGWGKIAHTLGVRPGRATLNATAGSGPATASGSGVVTATGDRVRIRQEFRRENGEGERRFEHRFERRMEAQESHRGIVTASGDRVRQAFRYEARDGEHRIERRFEQRVEAPAPNHGIVTAAGTPAGGMIMHGRGHGDHVSAAAGGSSSAVVTAGGAGSGRGGHGGGRSDSRGRD